MDKHQTTFTVMLWSFWTKTVDLSAMLFGIDAKSIDLATSINYENVIKSTVTLDHSATNVMALVSIYVLHESTATFIAKMSWRLLKYLQ